jgi:hypothetical protein
MDGLAVVIFIVVAALIAVGAYYAHLQHAKRQAALAGFAASRGWTFDPQHDASHDARYGHFSVFTTGDARYAYNTIRGSLTVEGVARQVQLGDYHYQTTSTSTDSEGRTTTQTHHHHFSYAILETPHLGMPDLHVRREGFFDRVASFLGFDDIDFESAEFSQRFRVKSSDKRFAYDVFHPRMMEFMLDSDPPTIDFRRGECCLTTSGCWQADEFAAKVEWAVAFFANWPRHLESMLAGDPARGAPPES